MNEINVLINYIILSVKLKTKYESALENIGYDVALSDGSSLSQKINQHSVVIADCRNEISQLVTALLSK